VPHDWSPLREDSGWDAYGRAVMRSVEPNASILACWAEATALRYFQFAEPLRRDVRLEFTCRYQSRVALAIADAEAAGRPLYATFRPDEQQLAGRRVILVSQTGHGSLWRIASPRIRAALN